MPKLTHISEMTPDAVVDLDAMFAKIEAAWRGAQPQPVKRSRRTAVRAAQGSFPSKGGAPAAVGPQALASDIEAALEAIPNSGRDVGWPRWNHIGMAIYGALGDDGFALFVGWSEKSVKYDAERTGVKLANYQSSPPSRLGAGTLFFEARQHQPNWRKPSDIALDPPPADGPQGHAGPVRK